MEVSSFEWLQNVKSLERVCIVSIGPRTSRFNPAAYWIERSGCHLDGVDDGNAVEKRNRRREWR